jgi:hypothetical protein
MQANMSFGVCDIPQAAAAPAPGTVSRDFGSGCLNRKPAQLQWLLLGSAFVAVLLSL